MISFSSLRRWSLCALLQSALFLPNAGAAPAADEISYNRDIRPILSDNCFFCHGPDANKRKGKMRLDIREEALAKKAFLPGKPDESELVKRILTADAEDQMPPADSNKKLTPAQKDLLRKWIAAGAKYEGHWAYIAPKKASTPPNQNGIDFLVGKRLQAAGLPPAPEADRRTLARRLSFDLVGLPPKPEEVEAFVNDASPDAYPKFVEKLLSSPHYGERMAIGWLDVVRFADTIGYHSDNPRNIWPYRDYVIKSFNENKRFDDFTREQLAGDLLPNPTLDQKVGSGFNRLLLSTEEGGAQPKDYEARMLTDRVRAVGTVWLGQTIGCAQCHDHKFDPITSKDFYSMGAFFADIKEPILGRREDGLIVPDESQSTKLARLETEAARLQKAYDEPHPELKESFAKWETSQSDLAAQDRSWVPLPPAKAESLGGATLVPQADLSLLAKDKNPDKDIYTVSFTNALKEIRGLRLEALPHDSLPAKGPGRAGNGNFVVTEVMARVLRADGQTQTIPFSSARASFEQTLAGAENPYKGWPAAAAIDGDTKGDGVGWAVLPEVGKRQQLILQTVEPLNVAANETFVVEIRQSHGKGNHTLGHFRLSTTPSADAVRRPFLPPQPKEIDDILALSADKRSPAQKDKLFAHFKTLAPELAELRKDLAAAIKSKTDFEGSLPRSLVSMSSEQPRTVRILPRGNFLVETGEIVEPALPVYLAGPKNPAEKRRLTRLDLANWMVSRDNPLTARVTVNRFWKQFFGAGLSKILDDFGAQGEPPPNQELLDWLASDFMENGWDVKRLVRLIVGSETYRRSSTPTKEARARDPFNREFSSQNRWRVDAELVRDNALAVSGLLQPRIGGPSVKPYQPEGYWENLNFPQRTWDASKGADQYRRGLYTWWQRSFLQPSMIAFDAPSREECVAERNRSNIPQQALVLLNDPTYVEASRVFAARIVKEGGQDTAARLTWAWRQALARSPRPDELGTAQALLAKHLAEYSKDPQAAEALLKVGQVPAPEADRAELAAWTSIARVILNLHETITRS